MWSLIVLVFLVALFTILFHTLPLFFPFFLGSLAFLFVFLLGVFLFGWALLIVFPFVLAGLILWAILWAFIL
uniref:Uncharacterized protein n=1 Tax=Candidatus Caldatribacterium californiense TaxID=1454726 RepID=A0A7V3YKC5_9BACT